MFAWIGRLVGGIGATGWIVGGLVAAALVAFATQQIVLHNRQKALDAATEKIGKLQGTIDTLADINDQNLDQLAALRAQREQDERDLRAELAMAEKVRRTLVVVRMENAHDPDANRPLADACPLLDRYFDRLRTRTGGTARGGEDRTGSGGSARVAGDLPGPAGTPSARRAGAGGAGLD